MIKREQLLTLTRLGIQTRIAQLKAELKDLLQVQKSGVKNRKLAAIKTRRRSKATATAPAKAKRRHWTQRPKYRAKLRAALRKANLARAEKRLKRLHREAA